MGSELAVLVYGEVHDAGSELLARKDLDLRWALTVEEALAASHEGTLALAVTSDGFGMRYLEGLSGAGIAPVPPILVILRGEDAWAERSTYRARGALALVSSEDGPGIIAAISEITGLTFRTHTRIPFHHIVDVSCEGEPLYLQSLDLSASGLSIRAFPRIQRGDGVDVAMEIGDRTVRASAMVVRSFELDGERFAGLTFTSVSPEDRRLIIETVAAEQKAAEASWMPIATPIADATRSRKTADNLEALGDAASNETYLEMLRHAVRVGVSPVLPRWVEEIRRSLVSEERRALRGDASAGWAEATVRARVDLARQLLGGTESVSHGAALQLCYDLAGEPAPSDGVRVQVTRVRAALLRAIQALALAKPAAPETELVPRAGKAPTNVVDSPREAP